MIYLKQLQAQVDEYLKNVDTNNILNLRISIPDFSGDFLLFTDKQLLGRIDPSSYNELCLFFSFKVQSKKSKIFLDHINQTKCLADFKLLSYKDKVEFMKKTDNNAVEILGTVNRIINTMFPKINYDKIQTDLVRIDTRHRLTDK